MAGQKQGDRKNGRPKARRQEEWQAKSKEMGRLAGQKQGDRKNSRPKARRQEEWQAKSKRKKTGSRGGFMHHTGVEILPRSATRRGLR